VGKLPRGHRTGLLLLCHSISWYSSKSPMEPFWKPSCPICGNWKFTCQPASWLTGTYRGETLRDISDISDIMKFGALNFILNIWGQYHHETAHMTLPPTAALRVCALLLVITCMGGGWILEQPRSSQLIWLPRVRATFRMLPKVWGHA